MLTSILYISSMKKEYNEIELNNLLNTFRHKNHEYNITGLLLYCDQNIIQYIEGEETTINRLYNNIEKDNRHKNIFLLYKNKIKTRKFPDWKLAAQNIHTQDFLEFVKSCIHETSDSKIISLFNTFLITNLRL